MNRRGKKKKKKAAFFPPSSFLSILSVDGRRERESEGLLLVVTALSDDVMHIFRSCTAMIASLHLFFVLRLAIVDSSTFYRNDYEPRVFDHIPSNCYDCLSYRDIILTQLTTIPARSFANFHLGSRDTNLILSGQLKLHFQPYAFQSLIIQKPNQTLTMTLAAPNSWLNITEKTFHGLDLRAYSTLRIIIKFFYGCTFHRHAFSGIEMDVGSRLILEISSVTQIHFEKNIFDEHTRISSIDFLISRTDTIIFHPYAFSSLTINSSAILSFHFELISHIHLQTSSFHSLTLASTSSWRFYALFLNRLTIDSHAFQNFILENRSIFNFTIHTLGTCLCLKSFTFDRFSTRSINDDIRMFFNFNTLRGLSFLPQTFTNISLNSLKISSDNPINDPNPIINFARKTFGSSQFTRIIFNFSSTSVVRLEKNALKTESISHEIHLRDITLLDLSSLNSSLIQSNFHLFFTHIRYINWFTLSMINSHIQLHFQRLSNNSCALYQAPRVLPWLFSNTTMTCHCPLLFAYKYGRLDGQIIPCIHAMSGDESAREMDRCQLEEKSKICETTIQSLTDWNNQSQHFQSIEIDHFLLRQLYDSNYLTCSYNYTIFTSSSSLLVRSRLFNSLGLVIGIILAIFIVLLILVMALLNGLQYKMREYDETWTWRRNMSWTSLRRTISQTSLRRSRKDLRNMNSNVITSKSDNQLDRLRYDQVDSDEEGVHPSTNEEPLKKN